MSEPDNFLARWSRLKRAAAEPKGEPQIPAAEDAAEQAGASAPAPAQTQQVQDLQQIAAPPEAGFDIASLPSIESIGADTDIRAFLQPGVPPALRHAALRRVWSADPAIRDFRGLQENDWDFNNPDAVPGFGRLGPDFDIRKMVSSIFGDEPPVAQPPPATDVQTARVAQQSDRVDDIATADKSAADMADKVSPPDAKQELVQRDENIASQQDESTQSTAQDEPRRHGGALPRILPEY